MPMGQASSAVLPCRGPLVFERISSRAADRNSGGLRYPLKINFKLDNCSMVKYNRASVFSPRLKEQESRGLDRAANGAHGHAWIPPVYRGSDANVRLPVRSVRIKPATIHPEFRGLKRI